MEDFLIHYGLFAVFIGTAVEGDVSAILAGVVAHLGFFTLADAIGTAFAGAVAADLVCYQIGRTRGPAIQRTRAYRRFGPLIERLAQRLGIWEIAMARFIYGARMASMLFWGTRRLPLGQFLLLDLCGCALWASVLGGLGFAFSNSAAALIGEVKRVEHWLLGALVVVAAAAILARRAVRRHLAQEKP